MKRLFITGIVSAALIGAAITTGSLTPQGIAAAVTSAQEQVTFAVDDVVHIPLDTQQIIITGQAAPSNQFLTNGCMNNMGLGGVRPGANMVVVDQGPLGARIVDAFVIDPLPPGTRIINLTFVASCLDNGTTYNVFIGEIATQGAGTAALIVTEPGVTLSADHEAIIKNDADSNGYAAALCLGNGPAVHATIWSDIDLYKGDRIIEFTEIWHDLATGETWYDAVVEW